MNQTKQIKKIKEFVKKLDPNTRLIKISACSFQESGLPDLMILSEKFGNFWVELKAKKDKPTKLQEWNIKNLRVFFYTGFIVNDLKFRFDWNDLIEYDFEEVFIDYKRKRRKYYANKTQNS